MLLRTVPHVPASVRHVKQQNEEQDEEENVKVIAFNIVSRI